MFDWVLNTPWALVYGYGQYEFSFLLNIQGGS